jgi:hypothetical protein
VIWGLRKVTYYLKYHLIIVYRYFSFLFSEALVEEFAEACGSLRGSAWKI